ncbi:cuticle protein 18.7-like [Prorops nasuta]|uniref:cuticle protein 18.7-like n=1 Tax=Prorops nasuta TaxID=863751 RepID=UPI0034CEA840
MSEEFTAMKLLVVTTASILLTLAEGAIYQGPIAPIGPDGRVVDTEEVARAKAAHFAAQAEALARLRNANAQVDYGNPYEDNSLLSNPVSLPESRIYDQSAAPIGYDGRVVDTPEVARAKAAHLAEHARIAARTNGNYNYNMHDDKQSGFVYVTPVRFAYSHITPFVYRGPAAPLGPDGRVVDTPEVSRAREAHLQAHARAASFAQYNPIYY